MTLNTMKELGAQRTMNHYINMLNRWGCTNNNLEIFFSRYNKREFEKASYSMSTAFDRFREIDVLAQADMLEASQTPCKCCNLGIRCNPSKKLGVLHKMAARIKLADKFYKKKVSITIF